MRRSAPTQAVPKQVFQHFAVLTVVLTACIAMFADGNKRQAITGEFTARQQRNQLLQQQEAKLGPIKLSKGAKSQRQHFSSGVEEAFLPGDDSSATTMAIRPVTAFNANVPMIPQHDLALMPRVLPPGMPASMQAERDRIAERKGKASQPGKMTQAQRAAMESASRQRSGAAIQE